MVNYRVVLAPWVKPVMDRILANWLAICIGHTIIAARPLSDAELRHELVHVEQWDRFGWTFPIRYALSSIRARLAGKHWYLSNEYEQEAMRAVSSR